MDRYKLQAKTQAMHDREEVLNNVPRPYNGLVVTEGLVGKVCRPSEGVQEAATGVVVLDRGRLGLGRCHYEVKVGRSEGECMLEVSNKMRG